MKFGWRGALGIVLSVALLAYTLRDVAFAEVWEVIRHSNGLLFLASAACATSTFALRAWRWRYILEPTAPGVPFGALWRSTTIGMMVNNTVPARAGEVARAYALSREGVGVRFTTAVASLIIDRVFDAMVLIALLALSMLAPSFPGATTVAGQPISRIAIIIAVGAFILLAALTALAFFPGLVLGMYAAVMRRIAPRFLERGHNLLQSFAHGLGALRSPRLFTAILFWTVVHWIVSAVSFYLGFLAVGIDAPFMAAFFLQSIIAIGVAAPSSPGFFGVFEFFGREGLGIYGIAETQAVSWALGYHILSFIPVTIIGAWYFVRMGIHLRDIGQQAATP